MLGSFRGALNTWPARVFFLMLAAAFAFWGVANKNPFGGDSNAVATVGGQSIDIGEVQQAYRQELSRVSRMYGDKGDLPPEIRRQVVAQALDQVVTQAALQDKVRSLGIVAPDSAVRAEAFAIPQFFGPQGTFDHGTMVNVLRNNNMTEQRFLELLRHDIAVRQLMGTVTAGASISDTMAREAYAFEHELRTATVAEFPFAAAPMPPTPTDAQLHRWYDNHPEAYSTPEYRRVKAVVLSPETVGRDISVGDDELKAAYAQHKADYSTPDTRSVEVLTAPDESIARKLREQWAGGADWAAMQKAAQANGATAVALDRATRIQFPAPELADAAFAVRVPNTLAPPVKSALGWYDVKVTDLQLGGTPSFDAVRDKLREHVIADKAADLIDQRSSRIDDMLAGGADLDHLPGDMGLGAVTGTLDSSGLTPDGQPAPIPGSAALRQALVQAAFRAKAGDPARTLVQAPAQPGAPAAYYAVQVDSVTSPAVKPFEKVSAQVRTDWTRDAVRREQDAAAAKLLSVVQKGTILTEAATSAGVLARMLPPTGRTEPADGVPQSLVGPLFSLHKGDATMVETPEGFVVAQLSDVSDPDPKSDEAGFAKLRDQLAHGVSDDIAATFASAVRDAERPVVNQSLFNSLVQGSD